MEAENQRKKEKTTLRAIISRCNGGSGAEQNEGGLTVNVDLIIEVLTWLPFKKMIQCQCLSKKWRSIIQSSFFMELYRLRFPRSGNPPCVGIIVSVTDSAAEHFMYALLEDGKPLEVDCEADDDQVVKSFVLRLTVPFPKFEGVTQVINGLVCFYNGTHVTLCNVCTREYIPLPLSPCDGNETSVTYHFGFDTINLVYKVLKLRCFFNPLSGGRQMVADVLTLGDGDGLWRTLDVSVPKLKKQIVCIAGKLYWIRRRFFSNRYADVALQVHSFDLCLERFNRVRSPHIGLFMAYDPATFLCHSIPMIYKERLALARITDYGLQSARMDLWILDDDRGTSWTRVTIDLPCNKRWIPAGVLPTGEILLVNYKADGFAAPIYSYDCQTETFKQRFLVNNFPTSQVAYNSGTDHLFRISCVEENIIPLDVVIGGGQR